MSRAQEPGEEQRREPAPESAELLELCERARKARLVPTLARGWSAGQLAFEDSLSALEGELKALRPRLVILLLGGTGVGKSTLLNALAGEQITETSHALRAHTKDFSAYYHEEDSLEGLSLGASFERHPHRVPGLREKIILDAPDIDSIESEHEEKVRALLPAVDLVLYLTSWQKYKDQHCSLLLKSLRGRHRFIFLLNQIDQVPAPERDMLRDDFHSFLEQLSFQRPLIFSISALAAIEGRHGEEGALRQLTALLHGALERRALLLLKGSGAIRRLRALVSQICWGCEGAPSSLSEWAEESVQLQRGLSEARGALIDSLSGELSRFTEQLLERLAADSHRQREQRARGPYGLYLRLQSQLLYEEGAQRENLWIRAQARSEIRFGRALERARALLAERLWVDLEFDRLEAKRESAQLLDRLHLELESSASLALPPSRGAATLNRAPIGAALLSVGSASLFIGSSSVGLLGALSLGAVGGALACAVQEFIFARRDRALTEAATHGARERLSALIEGHPLLETLARAGVRLQQLQKSLSALAALEEQLIELERALTAAPEGIDDLLQSPSQEKE